MATRIRMKNPKTGLSKDGFYGFSWTTLFFGGFPALFRGDFLTFIGLFTILIIIGLITFGIGAFVVSILWAFLYNRYFTRKLLERGYVFDGNEAENQEANAVFGLKVEAVTIDNLSINTGSTTSEIRSMQENSNKKIPDENTEKYKLYLVNKFKVEHNQVLNKYIVLGEIFSNIEEALEYCRELEAIASVEEKTKKLSKQQSITRSHGYQLGMAISKNYKIILLASVVMVAIIASINFIDIPAGQAEELEAKNLGFESAKVYRFWKARRFYNMERVNLASAKSPGFCFDSDGFQKSMNLYDDFCRNQSVIWVGKKSFDTAKPQRIDVYGVRGGEFLSIRSVDIVNPERPLKEIEAGEWYIFIGSPGDLNFSHPDLHEVTFSKIPDQKSPREYAESLSKNADGLRQIRKNIKVIEPSVEDSYEISKKKRMDDYINQKIQLMSGCELNGAIKNCSDYVESLLPPKPNW
jgi:hypothetical protein